MNKIVRFDRKDNKNVHVYISAQVIPDAIQALYQTFPNATDLFDPQYNYMSLWDAYDTHRLAKALDMDEFYLPLQCILTSKQVNNVLETFKYYKWTDGTMITSNVLKHVDKEK